MNTDLTSAAQHQAIRRASLFGPIEGLEAADLAHLRSLGLVTEADPPGLTDDGRQMQWTLENRRQVP